jgi:hypothetical protein
MSASFSSNQGQAQAAGQVVFHVACAAVENMILKETYPKDPIKAIDQLLELMRVDQLISQQVREAQQLRAQRSQVPSLVPPHLTLPSTRPGVGQPDLGPAPTPPVQTEVF